MPRSTEGSDDKQLFLASPRGFCRGVKGALEAFDRALNEFSAPIYVLYELVHNRSVSEEMLRKGAVFVQSPEEVPEGAVLLFGAHGVSGELFRRAEARHLRVIDATCPLVKRLHKEASEVKQDEDLVIFGHPSHHETAGVVAHSGAGRTFVVSTPEEAEALPVLRRPLLLTQTTLSYHEAERIASLLKARFPNLRLPGGVCNASLLRQKAVEATAMQTELVLIIGSAHSSNANRLRETAERAGARAILIETVADLPEEALRSVKRVGLSAGASTPDALIADAVRVLNERGYRSVPEAR